MSSHVALWSRASKHALQPNDFSEDTDYILNWIENQGIGFEGYSLLDIGCGTGTFALPLALKKAHVTALDLSCDMLKIINEKSEALDTDVSVRLQHADWSAFTSEEVYDIVLASMTPALSTQRDIEAMLNVTRSLGIFVGWKRYRHNSLLDLLLIAHNAPEYHANPSVEVKAFLHALEKASIAYNVHYFPSTYKRAYTFEQAKEYAYKQLIGYNIFPSEAKINAVLNDLIEDNLIVSENKSEKGVVLFSKCPLLHHFSLVC